jgi:hypothetical protein
VDEVASLITRSHSCDFFLGSYIKDQVLVPPLPLDIAEMKLTITAAIETIARNMLERVRDELITDWTFVGSRLELALSIFRVCKTCRVSQSNGTSYRCKNVKQSL